MNLLKVSAVTKRVGRDFLLSGINFEQKEFQKIAVAGSSGSGKSTLLRIIAGLLQPDMGAVWLYQQRVEGPDEKLIPGHPAVAYLSQHYELRNNYRVEELLFYANTLSEEEANALFRICRIDRLLTRKTNELSGGEKQRIAMARLLIGSPKLFLMDEPFSNLDLIHRNILKSVIADLTVKLKITCLLVSHDPADMLSWADEILIMRTGQLVQRGTPQEIYHRPVDSYAAGLFGKYNLLDYSMARSFNDQTSLLINQKKYFVRPGQLKIHPSNQTGLRGIVKKITFMGSYFEIETAVESTLLIAETQDVYFSINDEVSLSLFPGDLWTIET